MMMSTWISDALFVLERDGWCQEYLLDHAGRRCMHGALLIVHPDIPWRLPAELDPFVGDVTRWNDATGRTFDEVREVMLAAASLAMSEECL